MSVFYEQNIKEIYAEAKILMEEFQVIVDKHGNDGLVQYTHDYVDKVLEMVDFKSKISCKSECSFCCHSEILIPRLEKEYIQRLTKLNKIKGDTRRSKLQNGKAEKDLKWAEKACKFLSSTDGKGKCSIYEIRPILCRIHNSTMDIKLCDRSDNPNVTINEIKIIKLEAIMIALNIMGSDGYSFPDLVPLHKVF